MYVLVCFLALQLALGFAQQPKPCESPKQWTGRMVQVDHRKSMALVGKYSYDAVNERVRIREDLDIRGKKSSYVFIALYRKSLMYEIDLTGNFSGECVVSVFDETFRPIQVPAGANFAMEAYLGGSTPDTGVLVSTFTGEYPKTRARESPVYHATTVTNDGCIPVQRLLYNNKLGAIYSSFYDIMLGTDPEQFIPPADCKPGKLRRASRLF